MKATITARGGYMLIESLVYIAVLAALMGVGYAACYRCLQSSAHLRRNADQISKALQVGERWRADVRNADPTFKTEQNGTSQIVQLSGPQHQVDWLFIDNQVFRRVDDQAWVPLLTRVKASVMQLDQGKQVRSCHWDLELEPHGKPGRVRPLFTFLALSQSQSTP